MPLRSALAAFALLAAPLASAQSGLTATPNPYDASLGVQLVVRNATAAPVTLDSLRFASTLSTDPDVPYVSEWGFSYDAYLTEGQLSGSVSCRPEFVGPCFDGSVLFGRTLAPGDSLVGYPYVSFPVRPGARPDGGVRLGGYDDTLRVYSGGRAEALDVVITNVFFVAAEGGPEASALRVGVSPNPVRGVAAVTLTRVATGPVRVVALDALGRELAVLHDGPAAETLRLRVDTAAWPAGVVVVRASDGSGAASARLVVVR